MISISSKMDDYVMGGWSNMSASSLKELSKTLSFESHTVKALEGKSQVVAGMNYAVVLEHESAGKCLKVFNHRPFDQMTPVQNITLVNEYVNNLLSASKVTLCDNDQSNVMLKAILPKESKTGQQPVEEDISPTKQIMDNQYPKMLGGWSEITDQEELGFLAKQFHLSDQNMTLLGAKTQIVAGMNYIFAVQPKSKNPCVLTLHHQAWKKDKSVSAMNQQLLNPENHFKFANVNSSGPLGYCDSGMAQKCLANIDMQLTKKSKADDSEMLQMWQQVDPSLTTEVSEAMNLEMNNKAITSNMFAFQSYNPTFAFEISNKNVTNESERDPCIMFVKLEDQQNVTFPSQSDASMNALMNTHFPGKHCCDYEELSYEDQPVEQMSGQMTEVFFDPSKKELVNMTQSLDFNQYQLLSRQDMSGLKTIMNCSGNSTQPVFGIGNAEMKYLFVMVDENYLPCKMAAKISPDSKGENVFNDTTQDEVFRGMLPNIDPCTEEEILEYSSNEKIRILI